MGDVREMGKLIELNERRGRWCPHLKVEVCPEDRTVSCRTCKAVLDPFAVLRGFARRETRLRGYETEVRELKRRIEELRAEERRIKARMARARKKEERHG